MAQICKRGRTWSVRWREGTRQRERSCPDLASARKLRAEIERTVALGERWEAANVQAEPRLVQRGANPDAVEVLVEHVLGGTRDPYTDPAALPLVEAVKLIPELPATATVRTANVVSISRGSRSG